MDGKASIAALLICAGSLMLPAPARAQLYNFNVSGVPGIETGSYHVVLDAIDNNTEFQIESIQANGGANTPSADVFRVRLLFYSGLNGTGTNIGGLGIVPTQDSAGTNLAETNWGGGDISGSPSNPMFAHYAEYLNPNYKTGVNDILANGSNVFSQTGWFTVSSPLNVESIEVQLNDGMSFTGGTNVPEAASLVLLVAGLIPLGLTLRHRSARGRDSVPRG